MRVGHGRSRSIRGSNEHGETLIELLATVILMATGIVALVAGLFTLVRSSDQVNRQSSANLGVHGYAESLKDSVGAYAYVPCAKAVGTPTYPAFVGLPDGFSARIVSIEHWNGTVASGSRSLSFGDACSESSDHGLQRITIEVTADSAERPATERVVLTKRDQRCKVTYERADGKPC